jgi:hypothetical protein
MSIKLIRAGKVGIMDFTRMSIVTPYQATAKEATRNGGNNQYIAIQLCMCST